MHVVRCIITISLEHVAIIPAKYDRQPPPFQNCGKHHILMNVARREVPTLPRVNAEIRNLPNHLMVQLSHRHARPNAHGDALIAGRQVGEM